MAAVPTPWWQGRRGEWYVILQLVLLALVLFGPAVFERGRTWPGSVAPLLQLIGLVLLGGGVILTLAGVAGLRRNLSPLPPPKSTATLVTSGAYRLVRHPIYGGLTLFALGWSLALGGWLTLLCAAALFVLLQRKSALEERFLLERFPDYRAYRDRTRRFLPFLY